LCFVYLHFHLKKVIFIFPTGIHSAHFFLTVHILFFHANIFTTNAIKTQHTLLLFTFRSSIAFLTQLLTQTFSLSLSVSQAHKIICVCAMRHININIEIEMLLNLSLSFYQKILSFKHRFSYVKEMPLQLSEKARWDGEVEGGREVRENR
jgi:hypothetical protein